MFRVIIKFIPFILLFFSSVHAKSQGRFYIRAGGGIIYYNGDLNDRVLTHSKLVKPALTAAVGIYFINRISIGIQYYKGRLIGNDAYAIGKGYKNRNLSFQTKLNELSLILEADLFPYKTKWRLNPFLLGGIGVFTFNPEAMRDGQLVALQPLGTEGQFIVGAGNPKPYKLTQAVAPLAIGFYWKINISFRLRLEISNHFTFTDYLDDVSKTYPDSASLSATPNGQTAVFFSSRRLDGTFPKAGKQRGNNFANDSYTTVTLTLVYNPWIGRLDGGRKGKKENCFDF